MQGDSFRYFLEGIPNLNYRVETSINLLDWQYQTRLLLKAVSTPLADTNLLALRFYRAVPE